jgi:hypothetical protein
LLDEGDAAEVYEVVRFFAQGRFTVNGVRDVPLVILDELARPKQEGQMLVVVEAPDAVRASWLQDINELNFPHQGEVALVNLVDKGLEILLLVDLQLDKAEEEHNEVKLMPSSIIDSLIGSEGFSQVNLQFWDCLLDRQDCFKHRIYTLKEIRNATYLDNLVLPSAERFVAEPHWLMNWWDLIYPFI